eukprot:TRINITY_DN2655_c1_g1_i1.p3 TRINITY_DN2655_c1_g1~~TRINITY_DN2655_c1_g1_i1.p3  ORF type:complete len:107 (+),score=6.71 TRINITY_DN2655_c1_g1_i1:565-885(+)
MHIKSRDLFSNIPNQIQRKQRYDDAIHMRKIEFYDHGSSIREQHQKKEEVQMQFIGIQDGAQYVSNPEIQDSQSQFNEHFYNSKNSAVGALLSFNWEANNAQHENS